MARSNRGRRVGRGPRRAACSRAARRRVRARRGAPVQGGKIVLGAEQYPECINVITQCSSASWLYWSATQYVMPRAMQLTLQGTFDKSPLLSEAPTLANGGLTQNPFTVKFKINPAAKWADGTAITCDDFEFTRNAIINTAGTYTTSGYDAIDKIDCSDESVAVLNYKTVYVDWPDVFGGSTGVVLEKAAFPNENTEAKIDLSKEMQDSIPFSGGPWKLQSWSKDQTVLVRNPGYWGHKPYLDQVTIVPRTDAATEINSLLSGDVSAIFPQPGTTSFVQQFATVPAIKFKADPGTVFYEALWMNLSKFPFNDKAVREALFWGTDRQAVIDGLIKKNNPNATVLGCGAIAFPGVGPWCEGPNGTPFAQYHFDANKVSEILTADGWAKDSAGLLGEERAGARVHLRHDPEGPAHRNPGAPQGEVRRGRLQGHAQGGRRHAALRDQAAEGRLPAGGLRQRRKCRPVDHEQLRLQEHPDGRQRLRRCERLSLVQPGGGRAHEPERHRAGRRQAGAGAAAALRDRGSGLRAWSPALHAAADHRMALGQDRRPGWRVEQHVLQRLLEHRRVVLRKGRCLPLGGRRSAT